MIAASSFHQDGLYRRLRRLLVLLALIGGCISTPFAQTYPEDEIIDITGLTYGRLRLTISAEASTRRDRAVFEEAMRLLNRNLNWSGLFDIRRNDQYYDLLLEIRFVPQETIKARILSQEGSLLFELSKALNTSDPIEKTVIELTEAIILQLTGERSIFRSAIVYVRKPADGRYQLVLCDTFGENSRVILDDGQINILPRWHPDAGSILFTSLGRDGSRIRQLDLKTGSVKTLFTDLGKLSGGTWGKNGQELIITLAQHGRSDLFRIDTNGTILEQITRRSSSESNPAWSPDGSRLLFVSNRSGTVQIYQRIMQTRETFRMTFEGSYNVEPCWSNDGANIVFSSVRGGTYHLFMMDREGEYVQPLTRDRHSAMQPVWSPNGRQVLHVAKIGDDQKLFIIRSDGTFRRRLTNSGPGMDEFNPTWTAVFQWPAR
jgi:tol-pal system beta propeller repeat protein TolB